MSVKTSQKYTRYLDQNSNGTIVLKTEYEHDIIDKDGPTGRKSLETRLRIRCLDCGKTMMVCYSPDGDPFDKMAEIGGVLGSKDFWKEIFKDALGEI